MYQAKIGAAQRVLSQIAESEGISYEEVVAEIEKSIQLGYHDPDPQVQAMWKALPFHDRPPTPLELIACISDQFIKAREIELRMKFPFLP